MSEESIEVAYEKFNLDPNQPAESYFFNDTEDIPTPRTVFEVLLVQRIYTNDLLNLTYHDSYKEQILEIQSNSELAHMVQAGALENIRHIEVP